MKNHVLSILCFLFTANCFSQYTAKKGYYISENDERIECLIKHFTWKNNPSFFEYKLSEDDSYKRLNIDDVKEFAIHDLVKFVKHTVDIDRASTNLNNITTGRNSDFQSEIILLKVLMEGEASLYGYSDHTLVRYFYALGDDKPKQLVYKKYINDKSELLENNGYKQQLLNSMKCDDINSAYIEKLKYQTAKLIGFFQLYNKCKGASFTDYMSKPKRKVFSLTPRVGYRNANLDTKIHTFENRYFETGGINTMRYSLEVEYALNISKQNLTILAEPTYQYFKYEQELESNYVTVDFKAIEMQIGMRYYFNMMKNTRLFLNGGFLFEIELGSEMVYRNSSNFGMGNSLGFAGGVGFKFQNLSLEFRQQSSRDLLASTANAEGKFICSSLILGYTLFKL